eukprot:3035714-Ditylum_brightwellii.AAC.1
MSQHGTSKKHQKALERKKSDKAKENRCTSSIAAANTNISIEALFQLNHFLTEYTEHSLGDTGALVSTCTRPALETRIEDLKKFIK